MTDRHPLSTREQEQLLRQYQNLIKKIAGDFLKTGFEWDDLVSEGLIGLVRAAESYDDRKAKFITYAEFWIRAAMQHAVSHERLTCRIPRRTYLLIRRIATGNLGWREEHGRNASPEELASYVKLPVRQVTKYLPYIGGELSMESGENLEEPEARGEDPTSGQEEIRQLLWEFVDALPERERLIIRRRFGLDEQEKATLKELGGELGCSAEQIRRLEEKALRHLKTKMRTALEPCYSQCQI